MLALLGPFLKIPCMISTHKFVAENLVPVFNIFRIVLFVLIRLNFMKTISPPVYKF